MKLRGANYSPAQFPFSKNPSSHQNVQFENPREVVNLIGFDDLLLKVIGRLVQLPGKPVIHNSDSFGDAWRQGVSFESITLRFARNREPSNLVTRSFSVPGCPLLGNSSSSGKSAV